VSNVQPDDTQSCEERFDEDEITSGVHEIAADHSTNNSLRNLRPACESRNGVPSDVQHRSENEK
jgi:hypothetical protein